MKYYFFKDTKPEQNLDLFGIAVPMIGLVIEIINKVKTLSGKDIFVKYIDYQGIVSNDFRTYNEIELIEVQEFDYSSLLERLNLIETLNAKS
jgi:hypothetical protein